MSDAQTRTAVVLTKAEKRILAHIVAAGSELSLSSRKLAQKLDLSRRTVQACLVRLNDGGFLNTVTGTPIRASVHAVCLPLPVPLVGGAILAAGVEKGGGAISPQPVESEGGVAQFCAPVPGAILPSSAQVPGAILCKTGPDFHSASYIRARDTNTTLTSLKAVSVSTGIEALCKTPGEVAQFAAGLFEREQLDWQMRENFDGLTREFLLPSGAVTGFLIEKWLEKLRSRYKLRTPGALYDFVRQDLPLWIRSTAGREAVRYWRDFTGPAQGRKPPQREQLYEPPWTQSAAAGTELR